MLGVLYVFYGSVVCGLAPVCMQVYLANLFFPSKHIVLRALHLQLTVEGIF